MDINKSTSHPSERKFTPEAIADAEEEIASYSTAVNQSKDELDKFKVRNNKMLDSQVLKTLSTNVSLEEQIIKRQYKKSELHHVAKSVEIAFFMRKKTFDKAYEMAEKLLHEQSTVFWRQLEEVRIASEKIVTGIEYGKLKLDEIEWKYR